MSLSVDIFSLPRLVTGAERNVCKKSLLAASELVTCINGAGVAASAEITFIQIFDRLSRNNGPVADVYAGKPFGPSQDTCQGAVALCVSPVGARNSLSYTVGVCCRRCCRHSVVSIQSVKMSGLAENTDVAHSTVLVKDEHFHS